MLCIKGDESMIKDFFKKTTLMVILMLFLCGCETSDDSDITDNCTEIESSKALFDNSSSFKYRVINEDEVEITSYDTSATRDVVIPSSINGLPVTSIGRYAFHMIFIDSEPLFDYDITSVVIPNSVTSIGSNAFYSNKLTCVIIPESVKHIGENAFGENLFKSYIVSENNPYFKTIDGVLFNKNATTLIDMPSSVKRNTYSIPDSITSIGDYAFANNNLSSIIIPESVTSIGEGAFCRNNLTNIMIPDSVTSIGSYAFAYNNLTSIIIPSGIINIDKNAFASNQIETVTLPDSVTTIERDAFADNQIESITILGDDTVYNNIWIYIGFPRQ